MKERGSGEMEVGAVTYTQGIVNEGERLSGGVIEDSPITHIRTYIRGLLP